MHYFYETPWWLPTLVALIGVVLFMAAASQRDKRLRLAGVVVVAVAVLLVGVSWALKSEREIVEDRTRGLLTAIETRDWTGLRSYLHPKVGVVGRFSGQDEVASAVKMAVSFLDINALRVSALDATVEGDTVQVSLQVVAHGRNLTQPTGWQLEWRKDAAGQWVLFDVDTRDAPGFDASRAREQSRMFR